MAPDPRQHHIEALGLTLWQPRRDHDAGADAAAPAPASAADLPSPEAASSAESGQLPQDETAVGSAATGRGAVDGLPVHAETIDEGVAALDWDQLAAHLARQDHRGATRPVFGVGARDADLLIVGEAPGAEEDRRGEPFVGRAGKLLDRMLFAIGRDRGNGAYIANICKFRPPNNRDPNAEEVAADRPYLERQIELLSPRLIIAVGRVAAQNLLETDAPLGKLRGRIHTYPGRDLPVLVTYHPAYLLRTPQHKARAWADLRQAMTLLAGGAA